MSDFETPGVTTDEVFSPGYVQFDCAFWGLPDNTMGGQGKHIVYRPLCVSMGYEGHELVTDAMREAVRQHYEARKAAEQACEADRVAKEQAHTDKVMQAIAVIKAVPSTAAEEMRAARAAHDRHWSVINEGGEGYVPSFGWHTAQGRGIAIKHGLNADALANAGRLLEG